MYMCTGDHYVHKIEGHRAEMYRKGQIRETDNQHSIAYAIYIMMRFIRVDKSYHSYMREH